MLGRLFNGLDEQRKGIALRESAQQTSTSAVEGEQTRTRERWTSFVLECAQKEAKVRLSRKMFKKRMNELDEDKAELESEERAAWAKLNSNAMVEDHMEGTVKGLEEERTKAYDAQHRLEVQIKLLERAIETNGAYDPSPLVPLLEISQSVGSQRRNSMADEMAPELRLRKLNHRAEVIDSKIVNCTTRVQGS